MPRATYQAMDQSFCSSAVKEVSRNWLDGQPGSGSVCTPENEQIVGELICSQEDRPGTHLSPREIDKYTGIDRSAVRRMVKRRFGRKLQAMLKKFERR